MFSYVPIENMKAGFLWIFLLTSFSSASPELCSPGFFGERCSFPCRCLDNSCQNTVNSLGCITGSCSPGYIGFPACQTQCESGKFGLGCEHKCSCTPENRCSPINGNCIPPNHCTPNRSGPGCQIIRSKLTTAPNLKVTCTSLTISWSAFNNSVDSGVSDVQKYRIELRTDTSTNFTELQTVSREQAVNGLYSVDVLDAAPGKSYWARVVPIFFLDMGGGDGYLEEGIASPPSQKAFIPKRACFQHPSALETKGVAVTTGVTRLAPTSTSTPRERLTGPRSCALVGLAGTWAVFQWHHGLHSCGLGELTGYELSLTSFEGNGAMEGEMVVKHYRTNSLTTAIVAADLTPGIKYRAQVFALYEQGSVACSDVSVGGEENDVSGGSSGSIEFSTFTAADTTAPPKLQMSLLERHYDSFVVRLHLLDVLPLELSQLWVSAFPVETRIPQTVGFGGGDVLVQTALGMRHHFSFAANIHPATRYRLYAWASSTPKARFVGVTMEFWTAPKPFEAIPNFVMPPPQVLEVLDRTLHLRFPNISGYAGGPLTDFFLAVSSDHAAMATGSELAGISSVLRRRLTLPSSASIVLHSRSYPSHVVVVGDGVVEVEMDFRTKNPDLRMFADPPLEPDSKYTLFALVASSLCDVVDAVEEEDFVVSPKGTKVVRTAPLLIARSSGTAATAVGTGVAIFLFVVCILLLALFVWWRCLRDQSLLWQKSKQYSLNMRPKRRLSGTFTSSPIEDCMAAMPNSYGAWSFPLNLRDPRFLVIDPERGPDNTLLGTKDLREIAETFFREYKSLPVNKALSQIQARRAVNRGKNRCLESLPFDHNRVHLRRHCEMGDCQTDYINASYMDSYLRRRVYISAQSPFNAATASDFWTMVVQCNVAQIVLLDNQIEAGVVKCTKYWPDPGNVEGGGGGGSERRQYDSVVIEAVDTVEYAHFSVRRFRVTDLSATGGSRQCVTQYHYHRWRVYDNENEDDLVDGFDHLAFIDFYFHVKMATRLEDGPILVHCEDGVSRSSVFVAFDTLFQQLMYEHAVTVVRTCAVLRRARQRAIPSPRRFALLYDLLFEAGIAGHALLDLDIRSALASLSQRNVTAGFTYLQEQWYLLHNYTPSPSLPSSATTSGEGENELAAVWVDGLTVQEDVILARSPITAVAAFWRLVFQHRISCVVDMEPSCYEADSDAFPFWPPYIGGAAGDMEEEALLGTYNSTTATAFTRVLDVGGVVDSEGEMAVPRDTGAWFHLAEFQLAQVGRLESLPPPSLALSPRRNRRRRRQQQHQSDCRRATGCLFKRRIIIRRLLPQQQQHISAPRRAEFRTVNILHFKAHWRQGNQVPPRRAMLQAIETFAAARGIGPAVVLCADGATRSGLFLAAHLLIECLDRDRFVDLFHTLKSLKLRRRAAVASVSQLRFLYRLLIIWVDEMMIKGQHRNLKIPLYPEASLVATPRSSRQDLSTSAVFSSSRVSTQVSGTVFGGTNGSNSSLGAAGTEEDEEEEDDTAMVTGSPRAITVLYRYFSEELSRLMMSKSAPYARESMGSRRQEQLLV
ncbi:Receptor-type tyrosine-protein phosphatase zeta [Echinococcus granulosus]|nr:Receptor-type tyrosine-protein phosphatase zeta [Echinococcus granulosus]